MNAVIYARYSSHSQTEQSIEGQLHDAYPFAEKNGYTVIEEYIDRAQTGTNDDRPSFQRMIRDAERHQFQIVIVWKLDRFARNRYDSAMYKRILSKHGVRVVSVMENITDSPEGIILEGLLESMAEYYSANLSENIKRGKAESLRKGLFPGGPVAIGYTVQDLRMVPDPRTAPIVQEIFERYAAGERTIAIVNDLNSRGLCAKRGAKFKYTTLSHILDNCLYTGDFHYGGQVYENYVTPLVSRDLFAKCAARRAANHRNPAAYRCEESKSLLLGKFFCGECGSRMIGGRGTSASGTYFYYVCKEKMWGGHSCTMKSIPKRDFEYAVCKVVSDFLLNKNRRTLDALADSIMEIYRSEIDTSEVSALEGRLKQLDRDLDKLVDSLLSMPESSRPRIALRMDELEKQKADVEARLSRKRIEINTYFSRDDFFKYLQVTLQDLESKANLEFIINHFVNSVYLYSDGRLVIYLNQLHGLPQFSDDTPPGLEDYPSGQDLFKPGKTPTELATLKDFSTNSCLYSYAPVNDDKQEYPPRLFFLHGHVGIMLWRFPFKNELIRSPRGYIIRQEKKGRLR